MKNHRQFICSDRGFTLLEVLIAMGLSAMLLLTLSAAMQQVIKNWNKQSNILEQNLDESLVILQIERALLGAFPHDYYDRQEQRPVIYFEGTGDELRWVSTVSPNRDGRLTAWKLTSDAYNGVNLALAPVYTINPDEMLETQDINTLLNNYRASFRYLRQLNDDEKEWLDEWSARDFISLPLAVHIELEQINEDSRKPQNLNILAMIQANEHARLRPSSVN